MRLQALFVKLLLCHNLTGTCMCPAFVFTMLCQGKIHLCNVRSSVHLFHFVVKKLNEHVSSLKGKEHCVVYW